MQEQWLLTVLWVCEIHAVNSVCKKHTICWCLLLHLRRNDCACMCRSCVCLCGWWSLWPSAALLPAVAEARLRLGHQKDQRWRAIAASAAGTAGVKRDAALNSHQAGFSLGRASLDPPAAHFQLRLDHQCDRWLVRGWHQPSSQHSEIVRTNFLDRRSPLWYEMDFEDEQRVLCCWDW